jgi:hypothetical protein
MRTRGSERRRAGGMIAWGVLCALAVAVVGLLGVQRRGLERLRVQAADERASVERQSAMLREDASRQSEDAADKAELERLRGDREALERLRGEVAALKKSVAETRLLPARRSKTTEGEAADIAKEIVPSTAWRNVGYATPAAAIETALWAAAGGDTDLLVKSFILEEAAGRKAEAMFAGLPGETRRRYAGPEELVAFMTAKDVPLEGTRIMTSGDQSEEKQRVAVQLRNAAGSVRQVHIELRDTPDGWRLVVPESAVERYEEQLKARGR